MEIHSIYCHDSLTTSKDTMPTLKPTCPSCGKPEGVHVVYGDYDLLPESVRSQVDRSEMLCSGDAITIDEQGRSMDLACITCGAEWRGEDAPGAADRWHEHQLAAAS